MSIEVIELAERIKDRGKTSAAELPELLGNAERLAQDQTQDLLTRALAHRAAGNAHQLLNQFQPALESYNVAISLFEMLDEPIELGRTLHAKVGMLFFLSRFDELFECSAKARRLFEQSSDERRLARLDVNLAHAYHRLGRHKEALESSERALGILQESIDAEGFISASINSAVTFMAMHDFEHAEERYTTAMEAASRSSRPGWVLLSRYNLACLRYLRGDTATALRELEIVRAEYARTNDEWMVCRCFLSEAEILLEVGDLEECIAAASRARVLGQKLGLNSEVAESLLHEAAAGLRLGRNQEAIDLATDLLSEATWRYAVEGNKVSTAVSKLQTALFRGEHGQPGALLDAMDARSELRESGLPHRMSLANIVIGRIQRANGELDSAIDSFKCALAFAECSRSQWMQFHASYELGVALDGKNDPAGAQLFRRAESLLDSLWDRLGSDDLKMMFLTDRENVYTHLVKSTITKSPDAAFHVSEKARSRVLRERLLGSIDEGRWASASELASCLTNEETLVEYFISGDDIFIFLLNRRGLSIRERRGAVQRLNTEWQNLERHLASCSVNWERLAPARRHYDATAQRHLENLYRELVEPIRTELLGTVVFAPHGFLHTVPLHALFDGSEYLSEQHRVVYTPSAALYCSPASREESGAPLFVAFSTSADSSSIKEVEACAACFNDSLVLINPSMKQLQRSFEHPHRLIHIAGHAGIDAVRGKLSWVETPEGRLTGHDLAEMQIRAKTLVVTGCQTARRMIRPGDEWQGLMRSFYLSGASAIVSALWDIRGESACRFAREFYRYFDGSNTPLAVQKAVSALRDWRAHPYFWAGFGAFVRKEA